MKIKNFEPKFGIVPNMKLSKYETIMYRVKQVWVIQFWNQFYLIRSLRHQIEQNPINPNIKMRKSWAQL